MSRTVELIVAVVSIVLAIGTIVAVPWIIRRLPADHFVRPLPKRPLALRIARNVLGFALIAAGIAMLFLPGQGIATIVIGLSVVDHPIKHRVMSWLLRRPKVEEGVQRLRAKLGQPPLIIPTSSSTRRSPSRGGWEGPSRA